MTDKAKLQLLIDLMNDITYRDEAQLEAFLAQSGSTIRDIFGSQDNKYWPYFERIRFKPASFFSSEYEYNNSWKRGQQQMLDLLHAMLHDPKVSGEAIDQDQEDDLRIRWDYPDDATFDPEKLDGIISSINEKVEEVKEESEEDIEEIIEESSEPMVIDESILLEETKTREQTPPEPILSEDKETGLLEVQPAKEVEMEGSLFDVDPAMNKPVVFLLPSGNANMNRDVTQFLTKTNMHVVEADDPEFGRRGIQEQINEEAHHIDFAVVLLSGDYYTYPKTQHADNALLRPSQISLFNLGYMVGVLGKSKVVAVYEDIDRFKRPTNFFDVMYVPFDEQQSWKTDIFNRMQASGLAIAETVPAA